MALNARVTLIGSAAALSGAAAISPTFVVDKAGDCIAELIVSGGSLVSKPDRVTISTVAAAKTGFA